MFSLYSLFEVKNYVSSPFNGFSRKRIKFHQNYLKSSQIDRSNIDILPFNTPYWLGLPEDKNQILYDPTRGQYYTLTSKGLNIGVVGIFINKQHFVDSYFQIYIDPDFRGLGLGKSIAYLVAKKFNVNKLVNIVDVNKKRG